MSADERNMDKEQCTV